MTEPRFEPSSSIDLDRESPRRKRNRNRPLLVAIAAVIAVSLTVLGLYLTRDQPTEPTKDKPVLVADPPPTGKYVIRAAHSKLCLGVGPEIKDGVANERKEVFTQQDCDKATPPTGLSAQGNGLYRLTVQHPEIGPGCGQVDGIGAENLVQPTKCGKAKEQLFLLEPVKDTYLIRLGSDPDICLGVIEGSRKPKAQLLTQPCGKPAQKWFVEKP